MCTLQLPVQLCMLDQICFYLGAQLLELCIVRVLVVDEVFQDEDLIVVYFIDWHFLEVFDH